MENSFKGPNHTIVAGLKFDGESSNFLRSVSQFCQRTSMALRAVHVVEQLAPFSYYYPTILGGYGAPGWVFEHREQAILNAENRMEGALSDISAPKLETQVLLEQSISDALLADAIAHNASLVVLGLTEHNYQLIPKGLSVILSLLAASRIPVLVLRNDARIDFKKDSLRILIADDLSPNCSKAVWTGMNLAAAFGRTEIMHVHVMNQTLKDMAEKARSGPAGEISQQSEDFWTRAERAITSTLLSRSENMQDEVRNAHCQYTSFVTAGHAADELNSLYWDFKPDIAVYGRHQAIRYKPFGIGHVPLKAMLSGAKGVLIIPPE